MTEPSCANCTHPEHMHESGECWFDYTTDRESWDPKDQCGCGWWKPNVAQPGTLWTGTPEDLALMDATKQVLAEMRAQIREQDRDE